ncbi:MAG: bifunctional phosphoribosylaminoimidazolecarboxamide formyltransferase/IMP cyclohydrolase [Chthonomonadales bacterium]|nr:bifunctional phosphoribosylaminoimidazolecarboxamide formyltransferase/IMP cyclohydrolase [Chthonomonadales bacterium]
MASNKSENRPIALLSVTDKSGLIPFATGLVEFGYEIVSTGGTARTLSEAGISVTAIESLTGFPEMLDGRIKTLHPLVHGGILFRRDLPEHVQSAAAAGIRPISLVCINLYRFADAVSSGSGVQDCIENIDIGGPAMIRSAAKNHRDVTVVTDASDYEAVLADMRDNGGACSEAMRRRLAAKAFSLTAAYDAEIASWMRDLAGVTDMPASYASGGALAYACRYGENPHQRAAFYRQIPSGEPCIGHAEVLGGKEMSYNNLCDANAALEAVKEFHDAAACVIVKHTNPCGAAIGDNLAEAFRAALECDPVSAFGGIAAFTRPMDAETAGLLTDPGQFYEVIIAPSYEPEALAVLTQRPKWGGSVRLLAVGPLEGWRQRARGWETKQLVGGFLVQERDLHIVSPADLRVVTRRAPTEAERDALMFAWRVVRHVKSNAIVLAQGTTLVGVGAGQMNRVQSVRLAVGQAGEKARGAVMASDAFFPFSDGPEAAASAGVTAIIQPGGSRRDSDTIAVCDAHSIAMVFTGIRHFRH